MRTLLDQTTRITGCFTVPYSQQHINIGNYDAKYIMAHYQELLQPVTMHVCYVQWYDGKQAIYLRCDDVIAVTGSNNFTNQLLINGIKFVSTTSLLNQQQSPQFQQWLNNLNRIKKSEQ